MKKNKQPNSLDLLVGQRIRTQRLVSGLSQSDLGSQLGVTFQQVQKYEKGANRVGAGRLQTIAEVLNVPIGYFFGQGDGLPVQDQAADSTIFDFLRSARAVKLLRHFSRIEDQAIQAAIVDLVEKLSEKK